MLEKLHEGHLGINKTIARARDVLFWPRMSVEITEKIKNCPVCLENRPSQQPEPLKSHEIPPFSVEQNAKLLMIYEINHIWTAEMKWRWRNDRRSERNLCNCVKKPEKNSGLQPGLHPWPRDYRCDALPTELWSHRRWKQVSCSYIINTHFLHGNIWTHNWPAPNVSGFIAQLVEHCTGNCEVTGSNPVEVLNFFQASLRNCINCVHCDNHFFIF